MGKHFVHWVECAARARTRNRRRKHKDLGPEPIVAPFLRILAAGRPEVVLAALEKAKRRGWPKGVYFCGDEVLRIGIVVASSGASGRPSWSASWRRGRCSPTSTTIRH